VPIRLSELKQRQKTSKRTTRGEAKSDSESVTLRDDLMEIIASKCIHCGYKLEYLTTIHVEEYTNGYEFHDLQVCPRCGTLYYTVFQIIHCEYMSKWKLLKRVEVGKIDVSKLDYPP